MSRVASTTPPEGSVIPERHPLSPSTGAQIPSHFAHCFGCGELHPLGLHLIAHVGKGADITAEFTVTENHQGAPGLAHGGLLSLAFDEALGKLMWLLRAPAVLHISARITGQVNRKVYSEAVGRLGGIDGEIAVRAAALFVIVPMKHFLESAPAEYLAALRKNPELFAFVDPEFDINP
jgi:hypothetical protein